MSTRPREDMFEAPVFHLLLGALAGHHVEAVL